MADRVPAKNRPLEDTATRFRVLRAFSGHLPGEIVDTSAWPFGRAQQLYRARYLAPVAEVTRG